MDYNDMASATPQEQLSGAVASRSVVTVGLPALRPGAGRMLALTPEAAGVLVERGFGVRMERGAAAGIHFSDESYARVGVEIVDRAEAFSCDIVLHLAALTADEVRLMRRGALLLTFLQLGRQSADAITELLARHVIAVALDLVADDGGKLPFADIMHEIAGRAAIAMASSLLADSVHGKGILLGGVAGIVPCEVTIIGSDIAAVAAARSARGLGATVRMFDNDTYRLRDALRELGEGVIGSALHPRVFAGALRAADVIVATCTAHQKPVEGDMVELLKRGAVVFDLCAEPAMFPTLHRVDLSAAEAGESLNGRVCYVNAADSVPRTAAMALSNTLLTMLDDISVCDGVNNALRLKPGLRRGAYTFLGKPVNADIARVAGLRAVDINLFIQFS